MYYPNQRFINACLFVHLYHSSICLNPNDLPNQFIVAHSDLRVLPELHPNVQIIIPIRT